MKYLYGAAVQGIQKFIFQTNELKDIVGASELVENICTTLFAKLLYGKDTNESVKQLETDPNAIINAAGNIKYIFDDETLCKKIVREFPKCVVSYAPGITVSQAVVQMEDNSFKTAINELESRLRAQRNKPMSSTTIGLMGTLRSRKTGLPVVAVEDGKEDFLDAATFAKRYHKLPDGKKRKRTTKQLCCKAFGRTDLKADPEYINDSEIAYDINKITYKNDWIAVIHADGNGLGQVVQKIGSEETEFKKFSKNLDKATTEAAVMAYDDIKSCYKWGKVIPIRPIVLGGDDFTVICRADIAIDYVAAFIRHFEENTTKYLGSTLTEKGVFTEGKDTNKLTACAGIAYIKSSFPFYYGYELAEALCSRAKKDAKSDKNVQEGKALPPSCIMFHKIQDSFVNSYDEIVERELTPCENISFEFGPYYLDEDAAKSKGRWTIDKLIKESCKLDSKEGNAVKSSLRTWMGLLHDNPEMAEQKLKRIKEIASENMRSYIEAVTKGETKNGDIVRKVIPVYDILAIHTINTQETK